MLYLPYHCVSFLQWILLLYKRKDDDKGASLSLTICGMKNLTRVILVSGYFRVAPTWSKRRNMMRATRRSILPRGVRFRFADDTNTGRTPRTRRERKQHNDSRAARPQPNFQSGRECGIAYLSRGWISAVLRDNLLQMARMRTYIEPSGIKLPQEHRWKLSAKLIGSLEARTLCYPERVVSKRTKEII